MIFRHTSVLPEFPAISQRPLGHPQRHRLEIVHEPGRRLDAVEPGGDVLEVARVGARVGAAVAVAVDRDVGDREGVAGEERAAIREAPVECVERVAAARDLLMPFLRRPSYCLSSFMDEP